MERGLFSLLMVLMFHPSHAFCLSRTSSLDATAAQISHRVESSNCGAFVVYGSLVHFSFRICSFGGKLSRQLSV
jgi:hypothetical protein